MNTKIQQFLDWTKENDELHYPYVKRILDNYTNATWREQIDVNMMYLIYMFAPKPLPKPISIESKMERIGSYSCPVCGDKGKNNWESYRECEVVRCDICGKVVNMRRSQDGE